MDLAEQPVALGCRSLRPGPILSHLVHPGIGERDRRVFREQLKQLGVVRAEGPPLVPAEHDARAYDAPAPLQRHAYDAAQRSPSFIRHVSAVDVVVAGKPYRGAARYYRSGHSLSEREDPAGLAGHADVGLLPVRAGRLVDAADRTRIAAEQLGAAPQDPFQQGPKRELAGQVLRHRAQPGRPCGHALLALR